MEDQGLELPRCTSSCTGSADQKNRPHWTRRRWLNRGVAQGAKSEYVDLIEKLEAAQELDVVEQALTAARERLGMDAAYVTTIDSGHQTIDGIVGDSQIVDRYQGSVLPIEQTYCMRMLQGDIPNVVPDARAQPALRDLAVTREIGAYVGVPVTLPDGRVHGTLCCVSREARSGIGDDELRFMQILAGIVATRLDRVRGEVARLTERFRASRAR
jgi:GAF domain-containing protein